MKSAISASNNLKSTLDGTTGGMKSFGSQSASTGNVLTSLASKAALAVGAFVSIRSAINFGKDVVNTGLGFEQGMANVSAISGATGAELTALSEKAKEMGATTKFSALEASDAMSYMAMAGWNSSQMIDGIGGIMNLAAASGEELASVSDIVTDSLTAFGLKASDSAEFADILAVASSKANTNVSLLGESFKNVAPTAGAMGYSVRDTTVALGLMANAGIKGGAAGTSLNSVMTRLAKPTKDVTTAMNQLGLEAVNADGSMKPLSQFIPELQAKFATLTDAEKGQYATMIAGKNAMSGFLSIVNSSPADFQALTDAMNNSEGAAQQMADTMNDTVAGKLTLLKSQFEGVKIAIFDALGSSQFKGVLQSVSDGLAAITPYVTTLTVAIGNGLFAAIQGIYNIGSTVFNAVKTAIENNGPAIDNLRNAFDSVKTALENAFSGSGAGLIQTLADITIPTLCNALTLAANLFSGLVTAASALSPVIAGIAGAVTAYKVAVAAANAVESIRNGLIAFSAIMTGTQAAAFAPLTTATIAQIAATSALNVVTSAFGAIMTFVTSPIGLVVIAIGAVIAIGVLLVKHWDTVKQWAQNLWNGIKNVFSGIKNTISNAWNSVKEKASAVWGGIKDIVSTKLNNIKSAYEEHGGGLKGAAAAAMTAVKEYYKTGYDALNALIGGRLGKVVDTVKQKLAPMVNVVKEKLLGIKDAFGSAFGNAIDFIKSAYNEGALKPVVDKITGVFSTVKDSIADKLGAVKTVMGTVLEGAKAVAVSKLSNIKNAYDEHGGGIKGATASAMTAVKEYYKTGYDALNVLTGGRLGKVVDTVKQKLAPMVNAVKEKLSGIKEAAVQRFNELKTGVSNVLTPIMSIISTVFNGARTVVTTVINGIKTVIVNTVNNIKNTVSNIITGIKGNFQDFANTVKSAFDGVRNGISTVIEGIKTIITGALQIIVGVFTLNMNTIHQGIDRIKTGFQTAFQGAQTIVTSVISAIQGYITLAFENMRTVVVNVINAVKTQIQTVKNTVSSVFSSVLSTISSTFESVKTKVTSVFETVKTTIRNAIEKIKGYFNFEWSLPKIKLPHFKITGSFSLDPPSVPSFGVEWYAKGGIMTRPTMFGMNGNNAMVGGESGAEAILPLTQFWRKLEGFVNNSVGGNTITNNIYVTVDGGGQDDETLANTVAKKIIDMIENM